MSELSASEKAPKESKGLSRGIIFANIIILAALVLLYVLFFTMKGGGEADPVDHAAMQAAGSDGLRIAYVNNDSIQEHYELARIAKDELSSMESRFERDIDTRKKNLENRYRALEENIEKMRPTETELRAAQQTLMSEEQELYALGQEYSNQLATAEYEKNQVYIDSVMNFLNRFNDIHQFDYILNYTQLTVLVANDTFDITSQVIRGLNEEWFSENPKEEEE